jgi:hypothetical protein
MIARIRAESNPMGIRVLAMLPILLQTFFKGSESATKNSYIIIKSCGRVTNELSIDTLPNNYTVLAM